jgi:hypothetical protein
MTLAGSEKTLEVTVWSGGPTVPGRTPLDQFVLTKPYRLSV